ncbi:hypothetical protein [Phenylobacterium sp.]|uniref:hypothetical protein n=1 Tax=Phenylobacterium sp. TaxID=1871053 RepID=UPI0025DB6C5F|nr:hypothetical protein [Phenylobacterium sp.]
MDILVAQFKWILLAAGLVTLTMLQAAVAPRAAFRLLLGEAPQGPLALMLARSWGVLIGLTGAMLVWAAFHPEVRPLVLVVAGTSKLAFIALVLSHPPHRRKALVPVIVDGALVVLFAAYLGATL